MAGKLAARVKLPPRHVAVHFNPRVPLDSKELRPIARALVSAVAAVPEFRNAYAVVRRLSAADLPRAIRTIRVHAADCITKHFWSAPESGFVQDMLVEEIQALIDKKGRLLRLYRSKVESVWLLVVVEGFTSASLAAITTELLQHEYRSGFDGVALLDNAHNSCWVLRTAP
jgi:hypothetical protein